MNRAQLPVLAVAFGLLLGADRARAQEDVAVVTLLSGAASLVPPGGTRGKVTNFMKLRRGDRVELPPNSELRLVYLKSSKMERWQGPAAFRAEPMAGSSISGRPIETLILPSAVPQRLAYLPELMRDAQLGGSQIRSARLTAVPKESVEDAKATYRKLRNETPKNDLTAELYLFSVLKDHQAYRDMEPVVAEMRRKQPESDEVKILSTWLENVKKR